MPVISNLVYAVTDTTIVATWTTDVSSDSNLSAGGKNAIDNGVAASSTSHQCIVAGLSPSTLYSCVVTSGGASSSPQNVTTAASVTRTPFINAVFESTITQAGFDGGDIHYNFVSNDNKTYMIQDDSHSPASANQQIVTLNEGTLAATSVNTMSSYGLYATENGTDGPAGHTLSNKGNGLFGLNGRLFMFCGRHYIVGSQRQQFYGNIIADNANHGATWNNFGATGTFNATGSPMFPNSGNNSVAPFFFGNNSNWGWVTPVRYAADDGTLGYNTAGNGIDGGNAYVYFAFIEQSNDGADYVYLGRIPRIKLDSLDYTFIQFWVGPTPPSPTDFVNDSNWSGTPSSLTKIITETGHMGWPDIVFIPAANRYVMLAGYRPNLAVTSSTVINVYEGPTPAGPWAKIGTNSSPTLGYYGHTFLHRPVLTNAVTDNISLKMVYSGDFVAGFPTYQPTYSNLILRSTANVVPTFVQAKGTTVALTGVNPTVAYNSNVSSGDLLVVAWRYNGSGAAHISSITDNLADGVSWNIKYDQNDGGGTPIQGGWAYKFCGASAACTLTFNTSGFSMAGLDVCLGEWSGVSTFRGSSAVKVGAAQVITSNTTPALAGDLQIGVVELGAASSGALTATTGYTLRATASNGGTPFCGLADILGSVGGSVTANFNYSGTAVANTSGVGIFIPSPTPSGASDSALFAFGTLYQLNKL